VNDDMSNIKKYVGNIKTRDAFKKAIRLGEEAGNPIG
jgi:hypothetical protein